MPEGSPSTDQQLDTEIAAGRAFHTVTTYLPGGAGAHIHAGGGGDGGHFSLSPTELDALIVQWTIIRDKIDASAAKLDKAARIISPPAADEMSDHEAKATIASVYQAIAHNKVMREYASDYVAKLTEARVAYQDTESHNSATMRASDGT